MPSEKRARQRAYREQKRAIEERRRRHRRQLRWSLSAAGVVALVVVLVVVFSLGSSPSKPPAPKVKKTTTTTTAPSATTTPASTVPATTTPGTPTTAPVSHLAVAPVCPPATAAGAPARAIAFTKAPPVCISGKATYDATVVTDVGTFVISMPAAASPAAVNNFVFLARYHYFNGIVFHRVIPGFVVQGGDPTGTGTGGPGYSFTGNTPPASCSAKRSCYPLWSVAMANNGGNPSTDGSQFFIVVGSQGEALPPQYTRFGQVVSGTKVVAKIAADGTPGGTPKVLHYMKSVTITQVAG